MENENRQEREIFVNELCETVFYLARYAECLEIDKSITVPDERELFWMVLEWAEDFVRSFDPGSEKDHSTELESHGTHWLLETFPYVPELDDERQIVTTDPAADTGAIPSPQRKEILDFVKFEDSTSVIWPWAVSAEEICRNQERLATVEGMLTYDPKEGYNVDQLRDALNQVFGVNPVLTQQHGSESAIGEQTFDNGGSTLWKWKI